MNIFRSRWITVLFLTAAMAACTAAGEGGSEGPEGTGTEGPEGTDGTGTSAIPFVSTGLSRGTFSSISLKIDETFSGLLFDTEIAVVYDPVLESFVGRLRNEAPAAVCDVMVTITLDGFQIVNTSFSGNPYNLAGLAQFGETMFEFPISGVTFTDWTVATDTSTCSSAPPAVAAGGEGAEGGSGESGTESGAEASPPIPINQPFSGTFQNQLFDFAYDATTDAFRGTVHNPTAGFICESRTEIHTGVGTQVIELGPTIPVNLAPGETLNVVMSPGGLVLDTYSLHPESTPCP